MSTPSPGQYQILVKSKTGFAHKENMYLGIKWPTDPGPVHYQMPTLVVKTLNNIDPANENWIVKPIEGTDGFRISRVGDPNSAVTFISTGDPIQLGFLDPTNQESVLHADDVGDGWVAINNHDRTRVFDARGDYPAPGADVLCEPWNHGDNQRWQFVPVS